MVTNMTFTIPLLAILGLAAGLEVGPVRLVDNKRYISYGLGPAANNSLLECPHQFSQGEELQKITWVLWDGEEQVGTYEWFPTGQGTATGLLEGVVDLSREDGGLELTELRYDLGGFYSCSATLTDGQVQEAAKWEALVIDTTSSTMSDASYADSTNCTYLQSITTYAVFPPPTVHGGMYSEERGGFYDEVTALQWLKVVYPNKSTSYSFQDRVFKIDAHTPTDAQFLFTLGVTKTDGTYISLFQIKSNSSLWSGEEGCAMPGLGPHQVVWHTAKKNCRDQLVSYSSDTPIKATVVCEEGYHAEGEVTTVDMKCTMETLKWITEDGDEPRVEDLQCVIDQTNPDDDSDDGSDDDSGGRMVSPAAVVVGTLLFLCLLQQ